jgi:hypothetical protein
VADDALLIDVDHTQALRRALDEGVAYATTREAALWTVAALERAAVEPLRVGPAGPAPHRRRRPRLSAAHGTRARRGVPAPRPRLGSVSVLSRAGACA